MPAGFQDQRNINCQLEAVRQVGEMRHYVCLQTTMADDRHLSRRNQCNGVSKLSVICTEITRSTESAASN